MNELHPFNDSELLREYVNQAAWFWFDASTQEMSLEANFHRLAARCLLLEMSERGMEEPTDAEVVAHARRLFPPDDLLAW